MSEPIQRDPRFPAPSRRTCTVCGGHQDTGPGLTVTDVTLERECGAQPEPQAKTQADTWSGYGYMIPNGTAVSLFEGPIGWGNPEQEGQLWMVEGGPAPVGPTMGEFGPLLPNSPRTRKANPGSRGE